MKKKPKFYVLRIFLLIFICLYFFISPNIFLNKLSSENLVNKEKKINYNIIEVWNIDTFEGGSVSRSLFLEKRALEFEKENKGYFFVVKNLSVEQALELLKSGKTPSVFSYGTGFGKYIKNYVKSFNDSFNVRKDLLSYGKIDNRIFALPYILGGYTLITNANNLTNTTFEKYLQTENCSTFKNDHLNIDGLLQTINIDNLNQTEFSSFELYEAYCKNKINLFLGTQRDYYRCINRENNGGIQSKYLLIEGYSDLIQYLSVVDDSNYQISCEFIKYLLSETTQEKLCNINMFNVLGKTYYNDDKYKQFEEKLNKKLTSKNAFI